MLFPTYSFLAFFVIVFSVYWAIPHHRCRLGWLLAASAFFYMSWNPWLITLILFSASVDYVAALAMQRLVSPKARRWLLVGSIATNLGLLAFFKYANFFLDNARSLAEWFGASLPNRTLDILLPLGISFYTFETISYIVDVYRGRTKAVGNVLDYFLFILFFPHLVAGPIVRPNDFLPQLARTKRWSWSRHALGVRLFIIGFLKKAVIADQMAKVADMAFADPGRYGSLTLWAGLAAYIAQIYGDFSGYSDMAIGLAHLFGFKLPRNFHAPYLSVDTGELWRRWHISLSTWLRDYLYLPLGGSRGGTFATCRNLMIVMGIGGLWHGARWNFVLWGLYNGVLLVLLHATPWTRLSTNPRLRPLNIALTLLLFGVGLVIFRTSSLADAGVMLSAMAWPTAGAALKVGAMIGAFGCLALVIAGQAVNESVRWERVQERWSAPALGAALAGLLLLAQLAMPDGGQAFIYFQF